MIDSACHKLPASAQPESGTLGLGLPRSSRQNSVPLIVKAPTRGKQAGTHRNTFAASKRSRVFRLATTSLSNGQHGRSVLLADPLIVIRYQFRRALGDIDP